jgi:hypothetical protein
MALGTYRDPAGTEWQVWDVAPYGQKAPERRKADRRGSSPQAYAGPERRRLTDRRVSAGRRARPRILPTPGLEEGWLCFEAGPEKRRPAPVPAGWDGFPEEKLNLLYRMAKPTLKRVR